MHQPQPPQRNAAPRLLQRDDSCCLRAGVVYLKCSQSPCLLPGSAVKRLAHHTCPWFSEKASAFYFGCRSSHFCKANHPAPLWHKTTFTVLRGWDPGHCGKACLCSSCLGSLKARTSVAVTPRLGTDASCWLGLHLSTGAPRTQPFHVSFHVELLTFLTAWQLDSQSECPTIPAQSTPW